MSIPYADIIVLALVAGFILLRLRSILGEDSGFDGRSQNDNEMHDRSTDDGDKDNTKVFPIGPSIAAAVKADLEEPSDKKLIDAMDAPLKDRIADIKKIEPSFNVEHFVNGAKGAFEMVLKAFHENDKETLKYLLADDIEEMFVAEAERNHNADPKTHTTLVSIPQADIIDIDLRSKHASIDIRFVSEQITVERDKDGNITGGDASEVNRIEDEWTFERDLGSKSPNWLITST